MFSELLKNVLTLGIITEDDVKRLTAVELMMLIIERSNGLLQALKETGNAIDELDKKYQDIMENLDEATVEQLTKWVTDGTMEQLINQTALKNISDHVGQIGQIPIRLDGEIDDTQAIQRVIDGDKPLYVDRDLVVSDTIRLKLTSVIIGKGKNSCSITMTNDNKWMFRLLTDKQESDYDVVTSLKIHDVCLKGKNILQMNELTESEFNKLGHIKGGSIERVLMKGKISNDIITSDVPTADELRVGGVAIQATKCFDMAIRDSEIANFGIAVDFLGCDINLIDNCRLGYNGRQLHSKRISTYGSQNKVKNCDFMWASKKGHIYLDGTRWDTIEDNYFEAYNANGNFIYAYKVIGTTIFNNRIDTNNAEGTNEIEIYPYHSYQVINNRFNSGNVLVRVRVHEDFYDNYERRRLGRCEGNLGYYTLDIPPMYKKYNNELDTSFWSNENPVTMTGSLSTSYPFEKRDGTWKLKQTTNANIGISLNPIATTGHYLVRYKTYDTDGNFFMNIREGAVDGRIIIGKQFPKGEGEIEITTANSSTGTITVETMAHVCELKYLEVVPVYTTRQ